MGLFSKLKIPDMGMLNNPRQKEEYHFLIPNQEEHWNRSFADQGEFKYSYRFVCFMDMLGCKKLVWDSETSQDAFKQVKKIASIFEEEQKKYDTNHWCNDFFFNSKRWFC